MYQFISAQVIPRGQAGGWITVNLNYTRMDFIRMSYYPCILEIRNTETRETGFVDFYDFPVAAQISPILLKDYLDQNPNIVFNVIKPDFEKGDNYVKIIQGAQYGLDLRGVNRNISTEQTLLPDQQIDLLISRKDMKSIDYKRIAEYGLVTVGGLLHWFDTRENGLMVYEGSKTAWNMGEARPAFLDFSLIGKVKKIRINKGMLRYPFDNLVLSSSIYLDVGQSIIGKTVFISIAGLLFPLDNFIDVVDDKTIKINTRFINFIDIFYETYKYIDYSSVPLSRDLYYNDQYVTTDFNKAEVISAILELSQSFLIVVDATNITVHKEKLHDTKLPGMYITPNGSYMDIPVIVGLGYIPMCNYFKREKFTTLKIPNYIVKNSFLNTTLARDEGSRVVRDINYGYNNRRSSDAYHLFIKKEVN